MHLNFFATAKVARPIRLWNNTPYDLEYLQNA